MKYLFSILIVILATATFVSLIRPGYFPMHDDIQAMRVFQMTKCFQDGQIPCRWVPDMGFGYGFPQFNYYPPLPFYIMTSIHILGMSILDSVKIGFILTFILSAIGMYLLAKDLWGTRGGIISSLFYLYLPYRATNVYARGAMGEIWAMIWFPWILWAVNRYITTHKLSYLIYLALSLSFLLTSHLLSAMMIAPFLIFWTLWRLGSKEFPHLHHEQLTQIFPKFLSHLKTLISNYILPLSGSILLALGLSAYYVLPAIIEKPDAHLETLIQGYFNYLAHYVSIKQLLLSTYWNYGSSLFGPNDEMSLTVGLLHWLIPLVSLIIGIRIYQSNRKSVNSLAILIIFGFFYLFLIHSKSTPIWQHISPLEYLQFPWRFLAPAGFLFSLAAGSIATWQKTPDSNRQLSVVSCQLLLVLLPLILFSLQTFRPQRWLDITDTDKLSGKSWDAQQTISIFDYLPIAASHPPTSRAPELPQFITGEGQILEYTNGTNWQQGRVEVTQPAQLRLPLFDYPGMKAFVDDQPVQIDNQNELGLITIPVSPGNHHISAKLTNTPIRTVGNFLTAFSIITLIIYSIFSTNYFNKSTGNHKKVL